MSFDLGSAKLVEIYLEDDRLVDSPVIQRLIPKSICARAKCIPACDNRDRSRCRREISALTWFQFGTIQRR